MNKPLNPKQLDLIEKPASGTAAVLAAAGLSPERIAHVESIISAPGPDPDPFDWNAADDHSIIVKPRPGVAVYRNRNDDVVIRTQNTDEPGEHDHFAFVRPESLSAVIKALKDELS